MKSLLLIMLISQVSPTQENKWLDIQHEGLVFKVWGRTGDDGMIHWNQLLPENKKQIEEAKKKAAEPLNFGIDVGRMAKTREYESGTQRGAEWLADAKAKQYQADNPKLHLTVIGTAEKCAEVVADVKGNAEFDKVRDHLLVQEYRPGEWPVSPEMGFMTNGRPTILLQSGIGPSDPRGGKVLYRSNDYAGGPGRLAEAIRKADPSYRPARDPGPANDPGGDPLALISEHKGFAAAVVVVLLILLTLPSKEPRP